MFVEEPPLSKYFIASLYGIIVTILLPLGAISGLIDFFLPLGIISYFIGSLIGAYIVLWKFEMYIEIQNIKWFKLSLVFFFLSTMISSLFNFLFGNFYFMTFIIGAGLSFLLNVISFFLSYQIRKKLSKKS